MIDSLTYSCQVFPAYIHINRTHTKYYTNEPIILFADLEDLQGLLAEPHLNLEIWLQGVSDL